MKTSCHIKPIITLPLIRVRCIVLLFFSRILLWSVPTLLLVQEVACGQQLSNDPLYVLVFEDNFGSVNYDAWHTQWPWGNNLWNSNYIVGCDSSKFPGRRVDVAYNTHLPDDTNRMIIDSGGVSFERLIFDRNNFNENIWVYHSPCPGSPLCNNHDCYTHSSGLTFCYYDSLVPFKFTGAMLKGKERYKFGYFEIRYKLTNLDTSDYNAYGPNFWMCASDTVAKYSEIDIFEQRGTDWRMDLNFHFRKMDPDSGTVWEDTVFWHGKNWKDSVFISTPYHDQINQSLQYNGGVWHTVGCEWTPDHIDTYYDSDDTIRRFSVSKLPVNRLTAMPLIIDLYMPAAQYCIPFNESFTVRPFYYDIDYVRVYQINQPCNCKDTSGYFPSFITNDYTSILYRDLTVGGGGSAVLNSGSYHLAGQDYVLLQSGFEASGTADVIISTTPCQPDQKRLTENQQQYNSWPDGSFWDDLKKVKSAE